MHILCAAGGQRFFSIDNLSKWAEEHDFWIILNDAPDNCTVNLRVQAFTAERLSLRVLFSPGGCVGHKIHRIVVMLTQENDLVGNIYALEFVYSIQQRRQQIWDALDAIIDEELIICPGSPCALALEASRELVDHTVLRFQRQIRSRGECSQLAS